jgi:hypothetical protein
MFIHCMPKYMILSFHWNKKVGIVTKFYFLKFFNNFKNHINSGNSQLNYAYSIDNLLKHQIKYHLKYQSYIYVYNSKLCIKSVYDKKNSRTIINVTFLNIVHTFQMTFIRSYSLRVFQQYYDYTLIPL